MGVESEMRLARRLSFRLAADLQACKPPAGHRFHPTPVGPSTGPDSPALPLQKGQYRLVLSSHSLFRRGACKCCGPSVTHAVVRRRTFSPTIPPLHVLTVAALASRLIRAIASIHLLNHLGNITRAATS
jgi:hypothetical protein